MATGTISEQISQQQTQISALSALVQGTRDPGKFYAITGSNVVFGCKVTQGYSATDMVLALEGAASGDSAHLNPDLQVVPTRPEEYSNIALVYGETFLMPDRNVLSLQEASLIVSTAPGTGYHRYDLVYIYVGTSGYSIGIAAGTAVLNASTPTDPTLAVGTLVLARVHVESNVTGIANSKITDLRNFSGRLQGSTGPTGPAGTNGVDGSVWRSGSGIPSNSLGVDNDFYLDVSTDDVYKRVAGVYVLQVNIKGSAGATGAAGSVWRDGAGVPSNALGVNGDYYLNATNGDVYFKATGTYSVVANIKGATGATGAAGTNGTNGTNGADGADGADGISSGFKYLWSTDTTSTDPTSGFIKVNNASFASVTNIYISETEGNSVSIASEIASWDDSTNTVKGTVKIYKASAPANMVVLDISGTITDNGTWDTVPVTYVTSNGSFSSSDVLYIEFSRAGNKGADGAGSGTVTSVSVVSANGLAGTVATATSTPAITLSTTVTGLLKGNGTAISSATANTDYLSPPSGTALLKAGSGGALANAANWTDYTPNQWVGTAGGTANALTLTPTLAITSYVAGQTYKFVASANNTTAVTIAISGLSALSTTMGSVALPVGGLISGNMYIATVEASLTSIRVSPVDCASVNGDTFNGNIDMQGNKIIQPVLNKEGSDRTTSTISAGVLNIDFQYGFIDVSLNAAITSITQSNNISTSTIGQCSVLTFTADGTARAVTWPAGNGTSTLLFTWPGGTAPTLTSTNGKRDRFLLVPVSAFLVDAYVLGQNS